MVNNYNKHQNVQYRKVHFKMYLKNTSTKEERLGVESIPARDVCDNVRDGARIEDCDAVREGRTIDDCDGVRLVPTSDD